MIRTILMVLVMAVIFLSSCKDDSVISFCEGVSTKGEGVKCGTEFTTGDLTAVIKVSDSFQTDTLTLVIFEKNGFKNRMVSSQKKKVGHDKKTASVQLSFYSDGDYTVKILGKKNALLGEGKIKIVDTY